MSYNNSNVIFSVYRQSKTLASHPPPFPHLLRDHGFPHLIFMARIKIIIYYRVKLFPHFALIYTWEVGENAG
ncbi:hypothetical protein PEC301875_23940 [Pectobacterium carotovorum subsp. carotovorum]|nr:hypothetical protein PEC301875_23940 [Pectobacterium carotovorum subsp. carotovorum]